MQKKKCSFQRNVHFLKVAAVVCCCVTQLSQNGQIKLELRIYFPLNFPLTEQEAPTSSKFKC